MSDDEALAAHAEASGDVPAHRLYPARAPTSAPANADDGWETPAAAASPTGSTVRASSPPPDYTVEQTKIEDEAKPAKASGGSFIAWEPVK